MYVLHMHYRTEFSQQCQAVEKLFYLHSTHGFEKLSNLPKIS